MADKFLNPAHGELTCEVRRNVLYNHPKGAFNREGIIKGWNHILDTIALAELEEWFLLDLIDPENLFTPDGVSQLTENFKNAKQRGLQGVALLCHNDVQRKVFITMLETAGLPYILADDLKAAEHWIKEHSALP